MAGGKSKGKAALYMEEKVVRKKRVGKGWQKGKGLGMGCKIDLLGRKGYMKRKEIT